MSVIDIHISHKQTPSQVMFELINKMKK